MYKKKQTLVKLLFWFRSISHFQYLFVYLQSFGKLCNFTSDTSSLLYRCPLSMPTVFLPFNQMIKRTTQLKRKDKQLHKFSNTLKKIRFADFYKCNSPFSHQSKNPKKFVQLKLQSLNWPYFAGFSAVWLYFLSDFPLFIARVCAQNSCQSIWQVSKTIKYSSCQF